MEEFSRKPSYSSWKMLVQGTPTCCFCEEETDTKLIWEIITGVCFWGSSEPPVTKKWHQSCFQSRPSPQKGKKSESTHLDRLCTALTTHKLQSVSFNQLHYVGKCYRKRKKILSVYQKLLERNHLSRGTSPSWISVEPDVRTGIPRLFLVHYVKGRIIHV